MIANADGLTMQIPNDAAYVDIVMNTAEAFAAKVGFDGQDSARIRLAVEEGVTNIIEHAFEPGERTLFTVSFVPTTLGLRIEIHDDGLPYMPPAETPGDVEKSVGTRLMRGLMDKFSYVNLGAGGKTLVMEKYLARGNAVSAISASEAESYHAKATSDESPARIPRTIRLLEPGNLAEAIEIAQCAYKTYGYGYFYPDIYYPEKLLRMNSDGTMVSMVAINDLTGDMMGHSAIKVNGKGDKVGEGAVSFVKPQYRGQDIFGELSDFRVRQARSMGLKALYTQAVMTHPASQKGSFKAGFIESGIVLAVIAAVDWKGFSLTGAPQRTSAMNTVLYLEDFPEVALYPPANHAEMLGEIYAHQNRKVAFADAPRSGEPEEKRSIVETGGIPSSQYACVRYASIGRDAAGVLLGQMRHLARSGIIHTSLHIPLQSPFTPMLCAEAEKLDFYFSGVCLDHDGRDMLMLQHNNCEIDYERISTASDYGRRLLEYIRRNDPGERA